MSFLHRQPRKEADATVSQVVMLKRINYGTATVGVTYSVHPLDEPGFDVVHEAKVKMVTLPEADPTLERLKQLGELRDSGVPTDAEFEAQKARILAQN